MNLEKLMKFKNDAVIETSDFWHDLEDGRIKPKEILEDLRDILAVEKAKYLLIEFKNQAETQGVLEKI
jgi:hypothetical protein